MDLTHGAPRSGRELLGEFAWLARLADKVRADHAGMCGEYIAYCPISMGFLERTGVTTDQFDWLVEQSASDAQILAFFHRHVSGPQTDVANRFILDECRSHLDEEDAEEGRA
jgi:hypothetical protein